MASALFVELSIAILGTGLKSIGDEGPTIPLGFGSPEEIGTLMLERFLIAFEAASILLLIAAVGAVVLAAKRRQDEPGGPEAARAVKAEQQEEVAGVGG